MSKKLKLSGIAMLVLAVSCQFQPLADFPPADSPAWYEQQTLPSLVFTPAGSSNGGVDGTLAVRPYQTPKASLEPPSGPAVQSTPAFLAVRGQSSRDEWPKKSFSLETRASVGSDANRNLSLLGFPPDNDYVLHSLWSDKSMARNRLIYTVAGEIQDWAPRTKYVELWGNLNPESSDPTVTYQGIYLVVEKIKAGEHRVPVILGPTAGDPMGGLIFQIDKDERGVDDTWNPGTWKTERLVLKRPAVTDLTDAQKTAIDAWVTSLEITLRATPVGDWRQYLDEASFVDFALINELGRNVDGYRLSTYLHKAAGGKLRAGPVWDFDLGMANDYRSRDPQGWVILWELDPGYSDSFYAPFWWNELLHDAEFRHALRARWRELRGFHFSTTHLLGLIDDTARQVAPAVNRNFAKWPSLNLIGDPWWTQYAFPLWGIPTSDVDEYSYTYADHVRSLKTWFRDRLAWLDSDAAWAELDQWASDQDLHLFQGENQ